ncbi:hypothetical protein MTX78_05930 [Hymenobacter tibetensis]|uniref:Uncharacterized protein n=1 Tax=Hymenobacter tibetensis TaxID=497967 RepID=A0ABY4D806_9BACT|nr:hypothetical protein [Hymenobacter tibetensis]UOG76133.1 hypothetical protein MTX78_05930 [Hymenobacter tibetensis]
MRFLLLCGLLAAMGTPAVAQTFEFDLSQQTMTAMGTNFHLDKLVDARADRSTVGSVHRGMDNTPASANLRRELAAELTPLLQQALPIGPATRPLIVRIHALSIYEIIRPTSETASAELVADFLEPVGNDTYRLLLSTSELAESKGLDVTKQHDNNIKR